MSNNYINNNNHNIINNSNNNITYNNNNNITYYANKNSYNIQLVDIHINKHLFLKINDFCVWHDVM